MILTLILQTSCGSLNKAQGELHYNNNVTKGQELLDLKKALDEEAIDQGEYDLMKDRIINDEYIKSFFRQLDEIDEEDYDSVSI
tara:strand:+ start:691 stop:942 length:252 start_codon:yes stop_codon:yes gene_type:complete